LSPAVGWLIALSETYPDLKANAKFQQPARGHNLPNRLRALENLPDLPHRWWKELNSPSFLPWSRPKQTWG
jgi:hypothetical protein